MSEDMIVYRLRTSTHENETGLAWRYSFSAVDDEIHHDLLNLTGVGLNRGEIMVELKTKLYILRNRSLYQRADFAHEIR
jgi:hypothetical protein